MLQNLIHSTKTSPLIQDSAQYFEHFFYLKFTSCKMDEFREKYLAWTVTTGEQLINWARPEGWGPSPAEGWAFTDFSSAITIAICYLSFVIFGRAIMGVLPPIKGLYPLKFLYNIIQVMLCSYMCIEALVQAWRADYHVLPCNNFDQKNPPILFILYVFYISKILDFADTVFIILEKRWKQLSFLHVYHHTSIFLVSTLSPAPRQLFPVLMFVLSCLVLYSFTGLM